jgi:3-oxoacyl-[acyl-carrier protein] reductase
MNVSFSGRNVVVTGASRGIGRSIALALAGCGANVSICARGEEAVLVNNASGFGGTDDEAGWQASVDGGQAL